MSYSIKKQAFIFLAIFFLTQEVRAEEVTGKSGPLIAGLTGMEVITVTATRNPLLAMDYPGMVSVIDQEEIERRQASTPDDILKLVPNVEFIGGPRRTAEEPSIRGFSGPDVIVLFDGARQNFNSAHDGRFFIDPELLKQVEVLRGPASSLYGSGGTGGVIEFRTLDAADLLDPGKTFGAKTSLGYQTVNNEPKESITLFGQPNSDLDLIGNFTKRDSGSIDLGNGTKETATDDDIITAFAKGTYSSNFHTFQGSFQHFENEAEEPNNGAGVTTDPESDDIVNKDISSDTYRFNYSFSDPGNNWLNPDFLFYYTETSADEQRLDNLSAIGPQGELLERNVDTIGLRFDNRSYIDFSTSNSLTLTYGGEFYQDEQTGSASSKGARDGVPDAEADFYGLFMQGEINLKQPMGLPGELLVIPSLRYDNFESSSNIAADNDADKFSPRVGVSYQPVNWLTLFGNYAQAFRAPTFDELYAQGTHFIIIPGFVVNNFTPNPNLQAQETETFEAGIGFDFENLFSDGDSFETKGTIFRINGDNFIDQVTVQPAPALGCFIVVGSCFGTTTSFNREDARLWGAEIEASYENRFFFLDAGYSRIDGKDENTGEHLGVLTPDQITLNTGFIIPSIETVVGWRSIFASEFDNANTAADERDSYDVHDVYVSWNPSRNGLKGVSVNFGVDNIFDEAYTRIDSALFEAGRNFKVNLAYTLNW